jgi:hypothetical protein
MAPLRGARRGSAGFTIVELMVALTGGLFLSLAVFALARDSGRFYQHEARIANATVSGLLGFERLRTDLGRAGFLASPNVFRDPTLCGVADATWPANLKNLASIQINGGVLYPVLQANGRTPPQVLLAGSYASADLFSTQVVATGAQTVFQLSTSQPALLRLGGGTNPNQSAMDKLFPFGGALRVVEYGRTYYGQIAGAAGGAAPTVTVSAQPPIQVGGTTGNVGSCGLHLVESGSALATINVVNFIHYDIRNLMTDAQTALGKSTYASLYTNSAGALGEDTRTELVRVEQDITGTPVPGTEEVVAEYAVDLNLQLTAVTQVVGPVDPQLTVITKDDPSFPAYTGPTFGTGNTPERIRSVRVRLGVRSREGDRASTIASGAGSGLFRFNLGSGGAGTDDGFARVRTFQADVALRNQADILW